MLIILILGFLISIFVRVDFFTNNNSINYEIKIFPHFSLIDIAFVSSNEKIFRSHIISIIFYIIFGLLTILYKNKNILVYTYIFMGLTLFQFFYEILYIYQVSIGKYEGEHFRIDILLFIFGFAIWRKLK